MPTLPRLTNPGFSYNPPPGVGAGAFGRTPGAVGPPPSTYAQVGNVAPALPQLTKSATDVVGSELSGQLSPGTINFLQDTAARFGISAGMPGMGAGGFGSNQFLRNLGMTSEGLSQRGVQDYQGILGTLASTQLQPGLEYEIASQNAINAAAPDPRQAAQEQLKLMQQYYNLENPATGTITTTHTPVGPTGEPMGDYGLPPAWLGQNLYV